MNRTRWLFGAAIFLGTLLMESRAFSGVDAPGMMTFDWQVVKEGTCEDFPENQESVQHLDAEAFFSTEASGFGDTGVLMWAGFDYQIEGESLYGILVLDFDLGLAPLDGETPIPHSAVQATFYEKTGDTLLMEGQATVGDVWIVDVFFHEGDEGAVEGDLAMVFADRYHAASGCRVFLRGRFSTSPSPAKVKSDYGIPPGSPDEDVYVSTGCSGDVYIADDSGEGCDCGGTDSESGDGCEGDSSSGSGCEGDSGGGDCGGGDSGGCSGDSGGGADCGGGAGAGGGCSDCSHTGFSSVRNGARHGLNGLLRLLPEISGLTFIFWLKRRQRSI